MPEDEVKLHGHVRKSFPVLGDERNPMHGEVRPRLGADGGIQEVLINEKKISQRIKELSSEISRDYINKELLLVGVLNGSIVFLSDLIRQLRANFVLDFIAVSSYRGTESSGDVTVSMDLRASAERKDVLLVEDIVDSGSTLDCVRKRILAKNPSSLKVCALLEKNGAKKIPVNIDYVGFKIPACFVVGYGLDYNGKHRGLPYIGAIRV